MTKEELFDNINNCRECDFKYGKKPFFFPLKEQKVMLITACPSIQAMFRPLTSIRFFRTISVALFGDANISPDYIEAIHDKIYWTHMNKCYNQEALTSGDFTQIPEDCRNVYIDREVSLLKPEIIIAFGRVVAERLFQQKLSDRVIVLEDHPDWDAKVFIADFPKTGTEKHLDDIRDSLSKMQGFEFMERYKDGSWTTADREQQTAAKGLRVNLDFEREAYEKLKLTRHDNSNDGTWLENVVLPNMRNCEAIARLEFFIEDQIRTMLMEVFSHTINWRILESLKLQEFTSRIPLDQNDVYNYLETNWREVFSNYFTYLITERNWDYNLSDGRSLDTDEIATLSNKLQELSKIRNSIINNGGYASPDLSINSGRTLFEGIRWYVNLVYVSNEGVDSVNNFASDIISMVSEHDQLRFGKP